MNLSGHTVLITGGASGIGLALAERFLKAGSEVLICGRREGKLAEARKKFPQLHTRVCDVAEEADRIALYDWAIREFPKLNILINNAGVQRRIRLIDNKDDWNTHRSEIAINVDAPVHLSMLFIPQLQQQPASAIINVSSGLAFAPGAFAPVYSATKAFIHSFTMTLRYQLARTSIAVIELVPPAVNTDLGGPGLHNFGAPLDEFADAMMHGMENGEIEIGYGTSARNMRASRDELDEIFKQMNARF